MLNIIWHIIVGFVVGLVARGVMPGAQAMGLIKTTLLGIVGGILGGLIARHLYKPEPCSAFHPAGFIMSVIDAVTVLFLWPRLATVAQVGSKDPRYLSRRASLRTGARHRAR